MLLILFERCPFRQPFVELLMDFPDVVSFKQFYASDLGNMARMLISRRLSRFWGAPAKGEAMLGIGFCMPYLPQGAGGEMVFAAMPAQAGAMYWPHGKPNRVAMVHDDALPFPDNAFNRVLIVHALEQSASGHRLLREVWRVLVPGGRALVVVPNRLGLWSQSSRNPFGYGRPYSSGQLKSVMDRTGLTCLRHEAALVMGPSVMRPLLKVMPWMEALGVFLSPRFGGVLIMDAEKQIYAALAEPVRAEKSVMIPVPAFGG